jgi:thioredoxin 1
MTEALVGTPISEADFEEKVLKSPVPVLVEVWASECVPCPMMLRHLEPLLRPYLSRIRLFSLDASTHRQLAERFQIRSTPALLVFLNGQLVAHVVHQVDAAHIHERLKALLSEGGR